jgi:spore coat polysaccharide biosynthesis protein SpsF (cytidylyltransferase family)
VNVVAVVQARLGSARLPGKVLAEIAGRSVLAHVLSRAKRIPRVNTVILAIPEGTADDPLAAAAAAEGVTVVRGSSHDVLDRYHTAAAAADADVIVRVTADCPLLDPSVSGDVVERFLQGDVDYVSNVDPPTFPDGYDTEVIARSALQRAWREATDPFEREHVTPYIRRRPDEFRLANVRALTDRSNWRLTLDTEDDLRRLRRVFALAGGSEPGYGDVIRVVQADEALIGTQR